MIGMKWRVTTTSPLLDIPNLTFEGGIPIVRTFLPEAKVKHKAAVGCIDKNELETLMARRLSSEQTVELIARGILQ